MKKGQLNIELQFPIISIIDKDVSVFKTKKEYLTCLKSYIPVLNKLTEFIIDNNGTLYKRKTVKPLNYINFLNGFSIKYGGFGVCYVDKQVELLSELNHLELLNWNTKILKINKNSLKAGNIDVLELENNISNELDSKILIKYLFYISEPTFFIKP